MGVTVRVRRPRSSYSWTVTAPSRSVTSTALPWASYEVDCRCSWASTRPISRPRWSWIQVLERLPSGSETTVTLPGQVDEAGDPAELGPLRGDPALGVVGVLGLQDAVGVGDGLDQAGVVPGVRAGAGRAGGGDQSVVVVVAVVDVATVRGRRRDHQVAAPGQLDPPAALVVEATSRPSSRTSETRVPAPAARREQLARGAEVPGAAGVVVGAVAAVDGRDPEVLTRGAVPARAEPGNTTTRPSGRVIRAASSSRARPASGHEDQPVPKAPASGSKEL